MITVWVTDNSHPDNSHPGHRVGAGEVDDGIPGLKRDLRWLVSTESFTSTTNCVRLTNFSSIGAFGARHQDVANGKVDDGVADLERGLQRLVSTESLTSTTTYVWLTNFGSIGALGGEMQPADRLLTYQSAYIHDTL